MKNEVSTLFETVVDGGYCIGCGVCTAIKNSPLKMKLNEYGVYVPYIIDESNKENFNIPVTEVCPFSNNKEDENTLAQKKYGEYCKYSDEIGYYQGTYAGYVAEGNYRTMGSSGGLGTWVLEQLFSKGMVDYVIHVRANSTEEKESKNVMFEYKVASSKEDIRNGSKSRYYPIEMSGVLDFIRKNSGTYAIVGVPCFIKAIRLLSLQDDLYKNRVRYCVGLVCGHLKSTRFADMFAWQFGIEPGKLDYINFRKEISGNPANQYGVEVRGLAPDGKVVHGIKPVRELYGFLWGKGFLKNEACEFCDDVFSETADLTIGDAWLPQYLNDSYGTNIVIVRDNELSEIIKEGMESGQLHLDEIPYTEVVRSQESGLRHRREGLAYRLYLKDRAGKWRPNKRVFPKKNISSKYKLIYKVRMKFVQVSHSAFKIAVEKKDFEIFKSLMEPHNQFFNYLYSNEYTERKKRRIYLKENN